MIRVRVDIVPYGNEDHSEQIGEMVLANVRDYGFGLCAYDAVYKVKGDEAPSYVSQIKHQRQGGFWELIRKILEEDGIDPKDSRYDRLVKRITM